MSVKKYLKPILSVIILATTVALFTYYLSSHPETVKQIKHLPPLVLLAIIAFYFVSFAAVALITRASLHIYGKHMGVQENFLFNAYSSLINFFGPGQSGPIFRGAYLKKIHNLGIKPYMFTLLIYYAFFGTISVMMMFIGSCPWWLTSILVFLAGIGSFVILKWYKKRSTAGNRPILSLKNIGYIFLATLLQLAAQASIFGIELHNTGTHVSIGQVLAYTGVANMALFLALTPGAIGIRESFLLFSQQLHHISEGTIVAANVTDRAVYIVFLGILFVLVLSLHAKDKLHIKQLGLEKTDKA